jgi:Flp pilus assembly protein TadD
MRKQPDAARSAFENCLRLNPNNWRAHGCLAALCVEQGFLDQAELHLREVLRLNPTDANAPNQLRQVLQAQGKPAP